MRNAELYPKHDPYTISEIQEKIKPIAEQYGLAAVYLFGSYARGTATDESDIDLLIDRSDSRVTSLLALGELYEAVEAALHKSVDIITEQTLAQQKTQKRSPDFVRRVCAERILLYRRASHGRVD